jgi:hypothetical protein
MNKASLITAGLILMHLGQAHGATEIELASERTVDGEKQSYFVNGLFQGEKSRYTIYGPEDPESGSGAYLLSLDGGESAYYIDTSENTCHHWSNAELVETLSGFMLKTTDKYNVKTSGGEIHKVFEKDAADIHGLPAKQIRINMSFVASYKYLFFNDRFEVERSADIWVTPELENVDAQSIFQKNWEYTGNEELDQKIRAIAGSDTKHILRSEINQTMTDKKGKVSSTHILQYVKSMTEVEDLLDGTFQLPDCDEVDSDKMEKKFEALLKKALG